MNLQHILKSLMIISLLSFVTSMAFTQERNRLSYDNDLDYYPDDLFFEHFVVLNENAKVDHLINYYWETRDNQIKVLIVYMLGKMFSKVTGDELEKAVAHVISASLEGINNASYYDQNQVYDTWRIRAMASKVLGGADDYDKMGSKYLDPAIIAGIPDSVAEHRKFEAGNTLLQLYNSDPDDRVRGISVIGLGRMVSKLKARKEYFVDAIIYRMMRIPIISNYPAWSAVRSLGIISEKEFDLGQRAFFPLLELRGKGFNQRVKNEITRTLNVLVNRKRHTQSDDTQAKYDFDGNRENK